MDSSIDNLFNYTLCAQFCTYKTSYRHRNVGHAPPPSPPPPPPPPPPPHTHTHTHISTDGKLHCRNFITKNILDGIFGTVASFFEFFPHPHFSGLKVKLKFIPYSTEVVRIVLCVRNSVLPDLLLSKRERYFIYLHARLQGCQ